MLLYEYETEMSMLTDEEFGRLCRFLIRYSSSGEVLELTGNERFYAQRVMNVEDYFKTRYEKVCERRRAAGKLGGRPKANGSDEKAKKANGFSEKQMKAKKADTESDSDTDSESVTDTESDSDTLNKESINKKRFTPPTIADVTAYCMENGYAVDAETFVDYYAANGWRLSNGNHMKDWQAAVRNWKNRNKAKQPEPASDAGMSREENDKALQRLAVIMEEMKSGQ